MYKCTTLDKKVVIETLLQYKVKVDDLGYWKWAVLGAADFIAVSCCFPGAIMFEWLAGLEAGLMWGTALIAVAKVYHKVGIFWKTKHNHLAIFRPLRPV